MALVGTPNPISELLYLSWLDLIQEPTSARRTVPSSRQITRTVRHHTRNSFSSKSAAGLPKRRVVRRNSSKSTG